MSDFGTNSIPPLTPGDFTSSFGAVSVNLRVYNNLTVDNLTLLNGSVTITGSTLMLGGLTTSTLTVTGATRLVNVVATNITTTALNATGITTVTLLTTGLQATGITTGTLLATSSVTTATGSTLGLFGVTPVTQRTGITNANTQGTGYVQVDVQSIATAVNNVLITLRAYGLIGP